MLADSMTGAELVLGTSTGGAMMTGGGVTTTGTAGAGAVRCGARGGEIGVETTGVQCAGAGCVGGEIGVDVMGGIFGAGAAHLHQRWRHHDRPTGSAFRV